MTERPILFNAAMVQAILPGQKTQTRRVVKWRGVAPGLNLGFSGLRAVRDRAGLWALESDTRTSSEIRCDVTPCPYGMPGDNLWVREAWKYADWTEDGEPFIGYAADGARQLVEDFPEEWASRIEDKWVSLSDPANYAIDQRAADRRWRPSIHMPRWASRITLEITDVRVERLQAISESDAKAEGVERRVIGSGWREYGLDPETEAAGTHPLATARESFRSLWSSINGAKSWDANPWTWVVEFKRVTP